MRTVQGFPAGNGEACGLREVVTGWCREITAQMQRGEIMEYTEEIRGGKK